MVFFFGSRLKRDYSLSHPNELAKLDRGGLFCKSLLNCMVPHVPIYNLNGLQIYKQ